MIEVGKELRDEDSADVIVMGCAGMARHRQPLEAALGVPVIDPTQAAVAMAIGAVQFRGWAETAASCSGRLRIAAPDACGRGSAIALAPCGADLHLGRRSGASRRSHWRSVCEHARANAHAGVTQPFPAGALCVNKSDPRTCVTRAIPHVAVMIGDSSSRSADRIEAIGFIVVRRRVCAASTARRPHKQAAPNFGRRPDRSSALTSRRGARLRDLTSW